MSSFSTLTRSRHFMRIVSAGASVLTLAQAGMSQTVEVMIHHFAFEPAEITIAPGATVRWENMDEILHSATSQTGPGTLVPDGMFDSGLLGPGDTFEFTFTETGTVYYFCVPHGSSMQGTIHVTVPPCVGDVDGNRMVDLIDLASLLSAFGSLLGSPGYVAAADFNMDNQIDIADLTTLLSNYGVIC